MPCMKRALFRKEGKQYSVSTALLALFSTPFVIWQMGVLFYSGTTMSVFGRTPIPLTQEDTSLVIALGYLVSILAICLFPRRTVWMERALLPVALAASVGMLLPLSPGIITALFMVTAFVCVFSIGTLASLAAQHFTLETTWRDALLSMVLGGGMIALLQNEFFKIDFTVFALLSVGLIALLTAFCYTIPARITVPYASRKNKAKPPWILFGGLWLINIFATLLLCFASSFAESVPFGVSVLYLSAALMALMLHFLRKKWGAGSVRLYGGFFVLAVLGFVLAVLSLQVPALALPACVLLGFIVVLANLWIFFSAAAFKVYPTRFIGAIGAGVGLTLALVHSGLLEALRGNIPLLYGIYAALSVGLLAVYFFMEPYFTFAWRKQQEPPAAPAPSARAPEDAPSPLPPPPRAEGETLPPAFAALSEQERNLARLVLQGHTETSVATSMNITLNTQKS